VFGHAGGACYATFGSLLLTNIKHYLNFTLPLRRKARGDDGDKDGAGCEIESLKRESNLEKEPKDESGLQVDPRRRWSVLGRVRFDPGFGLGCIDNLFEGDAR
jgi:hypothetical protein